MRFNYKIQQIISKTALYCFLIYFLFFNGILLLRFATLMTPETVEEAVWLSYYLAYIQLLFPIPGWIADAWIGRYKVIKAGIFVSFIANVVSIFAIIMICHVSSSSKPLQVMLYVGMTVNMLGNAAMSANIIPFILDQCIGASGEELSALIHWTLWTFFLGPFCLSITYCMIPNSTISISTALFVYLGASFISSITAITLIIVGKKWLDTTHQVTNPIKLIVQILNYARKNRYPRNRSALTYWEEDYPSRLDLAKQKYGGPFTEEEVEDARTVLQLVPLLICLIVQGLTEGPTFITQYTNASFHYANACIIDLILKNMTFVVLVPLYHFLLQPLFYKSIPKMLTKISLATIILFLSIIAYFGLDTYARVHADDTIDCLLSNETAILPLDYKWQILPQSLYALGSVIVQISSLEFVVAQTPQKMKGLTIGLWYSTSAFGSIIGDHFYHPFQSIKSSSWLSCDFYYYLAKIVFAFAVIIVFLILAKRYKLRVREREINVHLIAEEHYERYMDQEEDYWREHDYSYGSIS